MAFVDIYLTADNGTGREFSLSIRYSTCNAEPDVGIMSSYIDDWEIVGFDKYFSKRAIDKFKAWLDKRPELAKAIDTEISEMELD